MWRRFRRNFKELCSFDVFLVVVIPIMLIILGVCSCVYESRELLQNWSENKTVENNYNIAKTYFNNRKQGIINAYNAQVAEIHKNGLKTKDGFNGLGIDYSVGLVNNNNNNNDDNSNTIAVSFSSSGSGGFTTTNSKNKLSVSHFSPKLLNKLNGKIDAKLAKVKAFYNARILSVYKTIENNQKVDFISLTSDSASNGKNIQFSHADFDSIGSELNKNLLDKNHTLIWLIVMAILTTIPIGFELCLFFSLFTCDPSEPMD